MELIALLQGWSGLIIAVPAVALAVYKIGSWCRRKLPHGLTSQHT